MVQLQVATMGEVSRVQAVDLAVEPQTYADHHLDWITALWLQVAEEGHIPQSLLTVERVATQVVVQEYIPHTRLVEVVLLVREEQLGTNVPPLVQKEQEELAAAATAVAVVADTTEAVELTGLVAAEDLVILLALLTQRGSPQQQVMVLPRYSGRLPQL